MAFTADPAFEPRAWFGVELAPLGWFDAALVDSAGSSIASVTESLTASAAQTATADFSGARAETLTASESQTGALVAAVARSDTLAAADSQTGALVAAVAASDTLAATDAQTGAFVADVARAESLTATDSQDATVDLAGASARAESVSVADAQTATVVFAGAVAETLSASDSAVASLVAQALLSELLALVDAATGALVALGVRADTLSAADAALGTAVMQAAVSEVLAIVASQTGTSSADIPTYFLDEPFAVEFDSLETALEFDSLETVLVFLTLGDDEMFALKIIEGEVAPVRVTLKGRDPITRELVPHDLTGATAVTITVRKPDKEPIINARNMNVIAPATNGRATFTPTPGETAAGGIYRAQVKVTYPGSPDPIVRKFPGEVIIEDAIA